MPTNTNGVPRPYMRIVYNGHKRGDNKSEHETGVLSYSRDRTDNSGRRGRIRRQVSSEILATPNVTPNTKEVPDDLQDKIYELNQSFETDLQTLQEKCDVLQPLITYLRTRELPKHNEKLTCVIAV
jgi:hypothetical protein